MPSYQFTYPSTVETADVVLDDLNQITSENSLEETLSRALSLAVSEAFTNAVIHGNRQNPDKTINLRVQVNDKQVTADIIDEGEGGVERINSKTPSSLLDESGRGIDLIRYYADSSDFEETSSGGLKVSIIFRRKTKITV